ncbi:F-box protein At4g35930 [Linum grandiflorum]
MGKVSPDDGSSNTPKKRRRLRSSTGRYLKPGALTQLRNGRTSLTKSCTDLAKKRVAVFETKKPVGDDDADANANDSLLIENNVTALDRSPLMMSPVGLLKQQNNLVTTPKTPRVDEEREYESQLESLPMDVLVKVMCHLHHDQLRAVFHVSQRIRKAVLIARQYHFNYTTPDRSRQEMLRTMTPLPTEHWPFVGKGDGKGAFLSSPDTPKAPRHGPRPPSRLKITEMKQIAAVLFQDAAAFPPRCVVPSAISKPMCKSLASNRVLFYEDELCQAVAQNKLR